MPITVDFDQDVASTLAKQKLGRKRRRDKGNKEPKNKKLKQEKKTREIQFEQKHLPYIKDLLGFIPFTDPITKEEGFYSAWTQQPSYFFFFPLMVAKPEGKGKRGGAKGINWTVGSDDPKIIFTVLRMVFEHFYPSLVGDHADWEIWKWNAMYYGKNLAESAYKLDDLKKRNRALKCFGGSKTIPVISPVTSWSSNSKRAYAVPIEVYYKGLATKITRKVSELEDIFSEAEKLLADPDFVLKASETKKKIDANPLPLDSDSSSQESESDSDVKP